MKYVVTGLSCPNVEKTKSFNVPNLYSDCKSSNSYTAQMEVISQDGTTVVCKNQNNKYLDFLNYASATVTDGTIVACGGYDRKFF